MQFTSRLIENAVNEISRLPGIGKKSALRAVLHILKQDEKMALQLAESIRAVRQEIKLCQRCFNISDLDICSICTNDRRDHSILCVVEDMRDVMALENTAQYRGVYHVLGGVVSPINGIGPADLRIDQLLQRVDAATDIPILEIILALSPTMEGDTTGLYLQRLLGGKVGKITQLSRGVAVGSELEYADEITLGRSLLLRTKAD
jgi:recombination protein RecR